MQRINCGNPFVSFSSVVKWFLLTGTAGFIGNLVPDEITDQLLYFYQKGCKLKLRLAIALATWYNKVAIELY